MDEIIEEIKASVATIQDLELVIKKLLGEQASVSLDKNRSVLIHAGLVADSQYLLFEPDSGLSVSEV